MGARNKRAGKQREAQWAERKVRAGYEVGFRPRIDGEQPFDLIATRAGESELWEIKSTKAGPFSDFGPDKRKRAIEAASRAGAPLFLCWWPFDRMGPRIIPAANWPDAKEG